MILIRVRLVLFISMLILVIRRFLRRRIIRLRSVCLACLLRRLLRRLLRFIIIVLTIRSIRICVVCV